MSRTNTMLIDDTLTGILQAINDRISIIDTDLNIVWANDAAKDRFGNDIIGKKCYRAYQNRSIPCDPSLCICQQSFADGKIHEHESEVINEHGRKDCSHCNANVALRNDDGNTMFVIGISRDITEIRKAEAENDRLTIKLLDAFDKIDALNGLLTMCSSCKRIRTDEGFWQEVDEYIREIKKVQFS